MKRRIVYYDFGRILTKNELIEKINLRICELYSQGFNKYQILKIVFECREFRESFIDNEVFENIKKEYIEYHLASEIM